MCPFTATTRYRRDIQKPAHEGPWTWRKTMRRVTAAAIPVNWDYPVWKCGNLVSTADVVFDPWATATHRPCGPLFRVSRSNQVQFPLERPAMSWPHSVFPLVSNGSLLHTYCVPTTFPPSYPPPLFISPSPLFIPRSVCGHGDELLTRATIRSEGFLLQSSHYVYGITCVYLLSPSNSTARCLQFQWNLSTRVEQAVDVAKIPSLFPRINIRELYPLRRRWNFWINKPCSSGFRDEALLEVFCFPRWRRALV